MEDTSRTERFASPTTPLHLQHVENTHARRNSGEELDGIAVVSDRRRPTNTMSKRMGSSHKNGHGQGDFISIPADAYYVTNETASTSHTGQKYNRRKSKIDTQNKFLGQRHQLFSMIVALVVLSCSFPIYFTVDVFPVNENEGRDGGLVYPVHRAIDLFGANNGMTPRSKDHRPRIVKLGIEQFGSNVHPKYKTNGMSNSFVVNLVELPANSSAIMSDDLSPENENLASKPEPEPVVEEEPEPATPTNSSETKEEKACLPMAKWMTASYPNCNSIHEIDMHEGVLTVTYDNEEDLKFLGQGWFRDTWKYVNDNFEGSPPVVIKTLRIEREFLDEYFDLHRRDAVAMERLTFSPYVVNVHGYCGQSAINELAEGILGGKINNLEQLNRRLRGKETDPNALFLKLQIASKVSLGLAHVHNIHVSDSSGGRSKSIQSLLYEHTDPNTTHSTTGFGRSVATMAHYDINPRNIAVMRNGSPKLNDFNIAEFMTYDSQTNKSCGFRSRLHEPWWRAPEEMDMTHQTFVDEKVDVYALGEVLFHILTTHGPRGKMQRERMDEIREIVRNGIPPDMWEPFKSGGKDGELKKNPIVKAFLKAMDLCFQKDSEKRGTSIQVARVLHKALVKEEKARQKKKHSEVETWNN